MISQGKTIVKSKDCTLPVDWPAKNVDTAWGTASQPAFDAGSNNFKILINEFLRNNEETVPYTPYKNYLNKLCTPYTNYLKVKISTVLVKSNPNVITFKAWGRPLWGKQKSRFYPRLNPHCHITWGLLWVCSIHQKTGGLSPKKKMTSRLNLLRKCFNKRG